jgi:hypothetical protein
MGDQAPSGHLLINLTNSVLQLASGKYVANRALPHKAYLSRRELAQLLDNDMFRAPFMPVAENHQLAWTLGCVWGVQPGSMGQVNCLCIQEKESILGLGRDRDCQGPTMGMFSSMVNT